MPYPYQPGDPRFDGADAYEAYLILWSLLDDIDTASDIAKGDDKTYREMVEQIQRRRFEVGSTDGYTVTLLRRG